MNEDPYGPISMVEVLLKWLILLIRSKDRTLLIRYGGPDIMTPRAGKGVYDYSGRDADVEDDSSDRTYVKNHYDYGQSGHIRTTGTIYHIIDPRENLGSGDHPEDRYVLYR